MWNQNGQPRPPAVDGIKIFDNDDQAIKHYCCLPIEVAVTFLRQAYFGWIVMTSNSQAPGMDKID